MINAREKNMSAPVFPNAARENAQRLIELAFDEDLSTAGDLTSQSLIAPDMCGEVAVVARNKGVVAGLPVVEMVFAHLDREVAVRLLVEDGTSVAPGTVVATICGPLRSLLTGERTALNFLTHLSGVATLTRQFVDAAVGGNACILDTRKTLPGWRYLQKYAVSAGGGTNHRMGLYDGFLIKDNHLAAWSESNSASSIAAAIRAARSSAPSGISIEVEVDTLDQLKDALSGPPDIVLLDNMNCETLRQAVRIRDEHAPSVKLEASGGVTLETIADISAAGVERISVGALTHSAVALDLAFDWRGRDAD